MLLVIAGLAAPTVTRAESAWGASAAAVSASAKVAKLYGAGGLQGLEAYQTGLVISAEGHLLTINSLVLDQGEVTVVLADGGRYSGEVIGADPMSGVAVVKIDPAGQPLEAFDLEASPAAEPGDPVLALANVFGIAAGDEPVSLMHGAIAAVAPLRVGRGPLRQLDGVEVYFVDAVTSNPGAAGGALVDHRGRLLGMIGKELKHPYSGAWLNYALPTKFLATPVQRILQGDQLATSDRRLEARPDVDLLREFGFALTPEIVPRTPPFVDFVATESAASRAGMVADDLIVSVNGLLTGSAAELRRVFASQMEKEGLRLIIERGGEFVEVELPKPQPE